MNTLLKSLDNTTVRSDELDNVIDSIIRRIERLDSFRGQSKVRFSVKQSTRRHGGKIENNRDSTIIRRLEDAEMKPTKSLYQ